MVHLDSLLEQGAPPQDIYIVLGDLGAYLPLLRPAFAARGLTLYADERRTLASHPVVELCAASLAACLRSFRAEEVLRVAKTGVLPPLRPVHRGAGGLCQALRDPLLRLHPPL